MIHNITIDEDSKWKDADKLYGTIESKQLHSFYRKAVEDCRAKLLSTLSSHQVCSDIGEKMNIQEVRIGLLDHWKHVKGEDNVVWQSTRSMIYGIKHTYNLETLAELIECCDAIFRESY